VQAANSLALGTSPIVRALVDPEGGMRSVRALDNVSFTDWFKSHGGSEGSIRRMWDPIAYALGFLNCDQVCCVCSLVCLFSAVFNFGLWPFSVWPFCHTLLSLLLVGDQTFVFSG